MLLLSYNQQQTNVWFRYLLLLVFILWLTLVVLQYYLTDTPQKPDILKPKTPTNISIEQLTLPPVPRHAEQTQTTPKQVNPKATLLSSKFKAKSAATISQHLLAAANQQQVSAVYQQLSALGIDVQLAWPQDSKARQAVFDYMYQCVGMQFAVLNGNGITKLNQIKLSDYSDWIRVAQGSLTNKEQNWLHAFALSGTAIRLFPRQIDWRLSTYLANNLKGVALSKLTANYQLSNQQLSLSNIQVNNQAINDKWVLYQGKCVTQS